MSAERPGVKAGDRWRFVVYDTVPSTEPNRAWGITSVGPAGIEASEDGEPLRLTPELNVLSDWVFKPKRSRGTAVVDVAVVAYEKVRVPAGELDAFKLVAKAATRGISGITLQP